MNFLEKIDHDLLLLINGCHNAFMDELMWLISTKSFWIPFYIFLFYLTTKVFKRKRLAYVVLFILFSVLLSDLISVHLFKNIFQRYRPSHNALLESKLHFYLQSDGTFYKGGIYGFVSSHAANFLALITSSWLLLKDAYPKLLFIMIAFALLVCLSRIYLGVHYPSDVLGGMIVGLCTSLMLYYLVLKKILAK
jgi:undecaprenyl-diphosphatase